MFLFRWLWKNMKGCRGIYIVALCMTMICQSMYILTPYFTQQITDTFIINENALDNIKNHSDLLILMLIAMVGFTLLRGALQYGSNMMYEHSSQMLIYNVRKVLFDNIEKQDAQFYNFYRAISASVITDNTFTTDNPFRFSSEYHDDTLGLVYYNYRHYNPIDGRWCRRDLLEENGGINLYLFVQNRSLDVNDYKGLFIIALDYGVTKTMNSQGFQENTDAVDAHVRQIEEISDEQFQKLVDSKSVTIDGVVFQGDKQAYIREVEREQRSSCTFNSIPTYSQFKKKVESEAQMLEGNNDTLVIGLHGTVPENPKPRTPVIGFAPQDEIWYGMDNQPTADVKNFLKTLKTNGRIVLISCYQSQPIGSKQNESYSEGVQFFPAWGEIVKESRGCKIRFNRMRWRRLVGDTPVEFN